MRRLRVGRRVGVSIPAVIILADVRLPVSICDIAIDGIGFRGQTGIPVGETVKLSTGEGWAVTGKVIWASNGRGGIQLEHPLSTDNGALHLRELAGCQLRDLRIASQRPLQSSVLSRHWAKLKSALFRRSKRSKMVERACRKQGFSWLVDEEF